MNALLYRPAPDSRAGTFLRLGIWMLPGLCAPGIMMVGVQLADTTGIRALFLLIGGLVAFALVSIACACFDTLVNLTRSHGAGRYPAVRFARQAVEFAAMQLLLAPPLAIMLMYLFVEATKQ